ILLYFLYSARAARLTAGWRAALIALRCALIAVIIFCVMRPVIVIPSVVPQSTYVVVLVDDSASMSLPADGKTSRLDEAKELLRGNGQFLSSLGEKFKLRELKFSDVAERIDDATQLAAAGQSTDLDAALEQASRETAGLPTSGIIVISDGGDNKNDRREEEGGDSSRLPATLSSLRSRGIPVYSIGLGEPYLRGDVEIVRATAPRRVLEGSPVTAEVLIRSGADQKTVKVDLAEDNHVLRTQ